MLDTRGMGRFHPGPSDRSTLVTESAFGENRCCGAGELCCSIAAPLHQDPDAKKDACDTQSWIKRLICGVVLTYSP
jgi:hypothetical protein